MKSLAPLILLAVLPLAACDPAMMSDLGTAVGIVPPEPEVPPPPPPLPPAVAAALPPGVPSTVVFQDPQGCYLFSVEVTDPPSGYRVLDAAGNPICDGTGPAL